MEDRVTARPFLKWAGGKTQLLNRLSRLLPDQIEGTYFEPFLGSGALFFHLWSTGRLRGTAVLSDANLQLIDAWNGVKEDVVGVISELERHRRAYRKSAKQHYQRVRSSHPKDLVAKAARFIFLNKTCYNGLWRVNRNGEFNVPIGTYKNPSIFDPENLLHCSQALKDARIMATDYRTALDAARAKGRVVYLDPPYYPHSSTANFTAYTANGFSAEDQVRLALTCAELSRSGARILLSNHDNPKLVSLYRLLGFHVTGATVSRYISCEPGSRGSIRELLVRNH